MAQDASGSGLGATTLGTRSPASACVSSRQPGVIRRARDLSSSITAIDGREKRFTIGSYPDWSAEAARAEAKELRRRIDRGEDPANERKDRREAPTVRDLAERYKEEHLPNKASSQKNDWGMIDKRDPARDRRSQGGGGA